MHHLQKESKRDAKLLNAWFNDFDRKKVPLASPPVLKYQPISIKLKHTSVTGIHYADFIRQKKKNIN